MANTRSLLVIFLCLALLVGVVWWRRPEGEGIYLVYTALFTVEEEIADTLSPGDTLTDARGKECAGEILKITREKALGEDIHGVYELKEHVTLAVTLGGYGVRRAGEGRIGTLTPRVGEPLYLLGGARIEGVCVRVRAI